VAAEQKYAGDEGGYFGEFDYRAVAVVMIRKRFAQVKNETHDTHGYVDAGDDYYGEWTLVHGSTPDRCDIEPCLVTAYFD
jgi:hypothetical protein